MSKDLPFSRSEVSTARRCERQWFYGYALENDTPTPGFSPVEPEDYLLLGLCIHKGMEGLFKKGSDLLGAIALAYAEFDKLTKDALPREGQSAPLYYTAEQKALIAAFLWAWRIQFWDTFNNRFEILQIEQELKTSTGRGTLLESRCDLVVRERSTGLVYIPDWKVVKDARRWQSKFESDPQTWAQMYAVENALGEEVAGCIYWAFLKGDRRDGKQSSYLIYGYKKEIAPGVFEYDCVYRAAKGWMKFPIWEEEAFGSTPLDRIRYWVNWLPEETRSQQFQVSPEVMRDERLIEEWVETSSKKMLDLRGRDVRVDLFDPSRSDWNCSSCFAKDVCYGKIEVHEAKWRPREDHHNLSED